MHPLENASLPDSSTPAPALHTIPNTTRLQATTLLVLGTRNPVPQAQVVRRPAPRAQPGQSTDFPAVAPAPELAAAVGFGAEVACCASLVLDMSLWLCGGGVGFGFGFGLGFADEGRGGGVMVGVGGEEGCVECREVGRGVAGRGGESAADKEKDEGEGGSLHFRK